LKCLIVTSTQAHQSATSTVRQIALGFSFGICHDSDITMQYYSNLQFLFIVHFCIYQWWTTVCPASLSKLIMWYWWSSFFA